MNWFKGRFKYAFQGLFYAFTCDRSIRLQGIFGLIVILCGILFHCSLNEWMMLVFAIGLVWFSEIMIRVLKDALIIFLLNIPNKPNILRIWPQELSLLSACLPHVLGFMYFCPNYFKTEVK